MSSNPPDSRNDSITAAYHCPKCHSGYTGWHRCPEGRDRVEFECIDCGEHIHREPHDWDLDGVAPKRCVSCTLARVPE